METGSPMFLYDVDPSRRARTDCFRWTLGFGRYFEVAFLPIFGQGHGAAPDCLNSKLGAKGASCRYSRVTGEPQTLHSSRNRTRGLIGIASAAINPEDH